MYYCAFYYVSGMFRILGFAHSYFQASELHRPRNLLAAQGATSLPGTGLYELRLNGSASSLQLEKSSGGSHEAVWKSLREYLDGLKTRVLGYGQFSAADHLSIHIMADELIAASRGLHNNPNLSSTRNDVQYRQKLESWYPNSRAIKQFHSTDRITQILSNEFGCDLSIYSAKEYEDFFKRSLTLSGFVHHLICSLAEASSAKSLAASYIKFYKSLL